MGKDQNQKQNQTTSKSQGNASAIELLIPRFGQIKDLHAIAMRHIWQQYGEHKYGEHNNSKAMMEMSCSILGEKLFEEKLFEIKELCQKLEQKTETKGATPQQIEAEIEALLIGISQDLERKAHFFQKYIEENDLEKEEVLQETELKAMFASKDPKALERETELFYKKFVEYDGTKSITEEGALVVPKEFRVDNGLTDLNAKYLPLWQNFTIVKARNGAKEEKIDAIASILKQSAVLNKIGKKVVDFFSNPIKAMKGKPAPAPIASATKNKNQASKDLTEDEKSQLASLIELYKNRPVDQEKFKKRKALLEKAQVDSEALQEENKGLMKAYDCPDIREFEEEFKDFLKRYLNVEKVWRKCFGKPNHNEKVDLLQQYETGIEDLRQENEEIKHRIDNIERYKKAMADVRASKLDREQIIAKFDDIRLKNKIHLQKEMILAYEPLIATDGLDAEAAKKAAKEATRIEGIIRGGLLRQDQNYSMHHYFKEKRNTQGFIESAKASSTLWNRICGVWAGAVSGAAAGAGTYALANMVLPDSASAALGVLVGGAFGSATTAFWNEKKGIDEDANAKITVETFEAAMEETFGKNLMKVPELKDLSDTIQKLMHLRTCLLRNTNNMRTEYLRMSQLDQCKPALTKAEIDKAIHAFFANSLIDEVNKSVVTIYELNQEEIEKEGKKSIFTKAFRALFPGHEPSVEDKHRFTELMVESLVTNIISFCENKMKEKGFLGRNPKTASAIAGLIFGLTTAMAAVGVCVALTTPFGWGMLAIAAVAFAVTAIPGSLLTYKFRNFFGKYSLAHSVEENEGLKKSTKFLNDELVRMKVSVANKKATTQTNVDQLKKMAENKEDNDGVFSTLVKNIKKVFANEGTYAVGTTDGWFRQLNMRFRTSKLIQDGLQPHLRVLEEQATKQISELQECLLTGHLRANRVEYKKLFDFVNQTRAFMEKWRNGGTIAEFRLKEMIREEVLQIVAVAGIRDANNDQAPIEIPPFLKDFYTKDLGGSQDDLRMVRAMAKIEMLLPLAARLELALKDFSLTLLCGSNLYREKLSLGPISKGLILGPHVPAANKKISEANIGEFLENSYQFLLTLDKDPEDPQEVPDFAREYTHTKLFTLYKTLWMKQLAELVDHTRPGFDAGISHQVMLFIEKKWNMKPEDVEEMFLQIEHQEFITEASKTYSLIRVDQDPTTEDGLDHLRKAVNGAEPAYVLYKNKIYYLDENQNVTLKLKAVPETKEQDPDVLTHIFTNPVNVVQLNVDLATVLDIESLIGKAHDSAVTDAIRVNLAFGFSKVTPEQMIRQVVGEAFYKREGIDKQIFLVDRRSLQMLYQSKSSEYATMTKDMIKDTEDFIEEIIRNVGSFKDTNAPEIYIDNVGAAVRKLLKEKIDPLLDKHSEPVLVEAKAALVLHLANLDLYATQIAIAKLSEEQPKPVPVAESRGFCGFFRRKKSATASEPKPLSAKEQVLGKIYLALEQGRHAAQHVKKEEKAPSVELDESTVIKVVGLKGIEPKTLREILGDRPQVRYCKGFPTPFAPPLADPANAPEYGGTGMAAY